MTFYFTASPEAIQLLMGGLLIAAVLYVGIFYPTLLKRVTPALTLLVKLFTANKD